MSVGVKHDGGKVQLSLIPPAAETAIAEVLTFGAKKYARDNWKNVEPFEERYLDALLRHLSAYRKGEVDDQESGLPHLAHAGCCIMFLLERQLTEGVPW